MKIHQKWCTHNVVPNMYRCDSVHTYIHRYTGTHTDLPYMAREGTRVMTTHNVMELQIKDRD